MGNLTIQRGAGVTQTITLSGDVTGSGTSAITTAIGSGVIVNDDINASAGIVDTKLATIATAGKVSNSATTATNANTASAIVARDGSGNFAAGTITAALTGTASGNLVSGGALGTPSSGTLTNCSGTAAGLTAGNVTTNANLTGHVTSTGNAAVLGSFTLAQLGTAVSDGEVGITLGTATASTSGTSIDFTGIPSGVKRISVHFAGVSTNGTSAIIVQLGDSGGVENTGYTGTGMRVLATGSAVTALTSGFIVDQLPAAAEVLSGTLTLSLEKASNNTWAGVSLMSPAAGPHFFLCAGYKATSATLDRVSITTAGGANTFDAGEINITWEF